MDLFFLVINDLYPQFMPEYLDRFVIRLRDEIKNKNFEYEEILDVIDFSRFKIISSSKKLTKTLLEYIADKLDVFLSRLTSRPKTTSKTSTSTGMLLTSKSQRNPLRVQLRNANAEHEGLFWSAA